MKKIKNKKMWHLTPCAVCCKYSKEDKTNPRLSQLAACSILQWQEFRRLFATDVKFR